MLEKNVGSIREQKIILTQSTPYAVSVWWYFGGKITESKLEFNLFSLKIIGENILEPKLIIGC